MSPASNDGPFDQRPPIPLVTRACVNDATEIVVDGVRPVLCWGERCVTDPGNLASEYPRDLTVKPVDAVVDAGQVCTGTRCDRLGPRLRAAMAAMTDPTVEATRDHAAIILAGESSGTPHLEAWNRAADQLIDLGSPGEDDGEAERITVLGDLLIVTRECMSKHCIPSSQIIDARGRPRGEALEPSEGMSATMVVLDAEHRVVRGEFDELVLIEHGRVTATASLADEQMVRLDHESFAVLRCSGDDPTTACHLLWRRVEQRELDSPRVAITTVDDTPLSKCPGQ